jgi:hypothetical protein
MQWVVFNVFLVCSTISLISFHVFIYGGCYAIMKCALVVIPHPAGMETLLLRMQIPRRLQVHINAA